MKYAIAVTESGEIIASGVDCNAVLEAYKKWNGPGKAHLCEKVHFDRSKRIGEVAQSQPEQHQTKRSRKTLI